MIRVFLLAAIATLAGCDAGYRNSPEQQVADNKVCRDGGMRPYSTAFGEILCAP